jgi:hypothetical protein
MSKNYLSGKPNGHICDARTATEKEKSVTISGKAAGKGRSGWRDYLAAGREFLRRPKTRFDLADRGRFLFFLIALIILLQKVVEYFSS